jgi:hypothetical protein
LVARKRLARCQCQIFYHCSDHFPSFQPLLSDVEKDKEAFELKRAIGVMLALKDFEEKYAAYIPVHSSNRKVVSSLLTLLLRYNSSCSGLMSGLARNFVDLQSQLAAAVSRVTVHVPAALSALAGKIPMLCVRVTLCDMVIT